MKTKEFLKKIEELGFKALHSGRAIEIYDSECRIVASVILGEVLAIDTNWDAWQLLPKTPKVMLFDLLVEYARTPVDEREEEKKYYLRHRWARTKNGNWLYTALRKRPNISYFTLQGSDEDVFEYQVIFTREEIDEMKEKYNSDLSDFEIVEVEG